MKSTEEEVSVPTNMLKGTNIGTNMDNFLSKKQQPKPEQLLGDIN